MLGPYSQVRDWVMSVMGSGLMNLTSGGDISLPDTWEWIPLISHQPQVSGPTKDKSVPAAQGNVWDTTTARWLWAGSLSRLLQCKTPSAIDPILCFLSHPMPSEVLSWGSPPQPLLSQALVSTQGCLYFQHRETRRGSHLTDTELCGDSTECCFFLTPLRHATQLGEQLASVTLSMKAPADSVADISGLCLPLVVAQPMTHL